MRLGSLLTVYREQQRFYPVACRRGQRCVRQRQRLGHLPRECVGSTVGAEVSWRLNSPALEGVAPEARRVQAPHCLETIGAERVPAGRVNNPARAILREVRQAHLPPLLLTLLLLLLLLPPELCHQAVLETDVADWELWNRTELRPAPAYTPASQCGTAGVTVDDHGGRQEQARAR